MESDYDMKSRYMFVKCRMGHHEYCPGTKIKEKYEKSSITGRPIPTNKSTRVFCECPCHGKVPFYAK